MTDDSDSSVRFRENQKPANEYCSTIIFQKSQIVPSYLEQKHDSYLQATTEPRTTTENSYIEMVPSSQRNNVECSIRRSSKDQEPSIPPSSPRRQGNDCYF